MNKNLSKDVFVSSDQRCGGTAFNELARILLQGSCLDDPWSEAWLTKDEPGLPCDTGVAMPIVLDTLYQRWRCIKNCTTLWPRELYQALLHAVIERDCHIIFLWRENALQRAVSLELAKATRVFGNYDWTQTSKVSHYEGFRVELDIALVKRSVTLYQERTADVRLFLEQHQPAFLAVRYEDLFATSKSYKEKEKLLLKLANFWGSDTGLLATHRESLQQLLAPSQKMNSHELYQKMILNLEDIIKEFDPTIHGNFWQVY